jgi:hypothetical protein
LKYREARGDFVGSYLSASVQYFGCHCIEENHTEEKARAGNQV